MTNREKVLELCKELGSGKAVLRELVEIIGMSEILMKLIDVAHEKDENALLLRLQWALSAYLKGE